LLAEGLLLALAGGAVGLLLSTWATNVLMASVRPVLPAAVTLPEPDLDWRVFVGTVGFSLAAALLFGAWPAWALTGRAAAADLKRHVGEEGRGRSGAGRIGNALVIGQVALSLLLLASGGLFMMSAIAAATADPGFVSTADCSPKSIRVWQGTTKREGDRRISPWWIGCGRFRVWTP
jgi:putative ABC transport system permease protein